MKVWINRRVGGYSGGLILVAADSVEEAHEAFHKNETLAFMWDNIDGYVDDYYYSPYEWEELPNVVANVDEPQVLAEGGYTE